MGWLSKQTSKANASCRALREGSKAAAAATAILKTPLDAPVSLCSRRCPDKQRMPRGTGRHACMTLPLCVRGVGRSGLRFLAPAAFTRNDEYSGMPLLAVILSAASLRAESKNLARRGFRRAQPPSGYSDCSTRALVRAFFSKWRRASRPRPTLCQRRPVEIGSTRRDGYARSCSTVCIAGRVSASAYSG
jgi:hypothetical protein